MSTIFSSNDWFYVSKDIGKKMKFCKSFQFANRFIWSNLIVFFFKDHFPLVGNTELLMTKKVPVGWLLCLHFLCSFLVIFFLTISHWTYLLQILSKICFQRVAFSGNYETVAISTDKNTFINDFDYKADIGQHFH